MSANKIIEWIKQAIAGDISRVTIDGQVWVRATDLQLDQQEIMRINNQLRDVLIAVDALWSKDAEDFKEEMAMGSPVGIVWAQIREVLSK